MWAQVVNSLLGIWLMVAPAVLGYGAPAAVNDRIAGPIAASFAVIACSEVTRPARRVNLPLGLWLVVAPFVLGYGATAPLVNSLLVGVALAALSFVKGTVDARFGGGWRAVWSRRSVHEPEAPEPS